MAKKYVFIDYLRTFAAVLFLWDHLVPGAYYSLEAQPPVGIVERYILWPLAITNYFGVFAVDLFFLIGGFLTVANIQKVNNEASFILKRAVRLLPGIVFGYIVFVIVGSGFGKGSLSISSYLAYNGALWYVKVLFAFYIIFLFCIRLSKKDLFFGCLLLEILVIVICRICSEQETIGIWWQFGLNCSYTFYLSIGICIYILLVEKQAVWKFIVAFIISWYGVIHFNIAVFNPERAAVGNSFGVSAMYAILLFIGFLLANDRLPEIKAVKSISAYSYGLYLHHMPLFAIFLPVFAKVFEGYHIRAVCYSTIVVTLLFTVITSLIQVRFVERPFITFCMPKEKLKNE